MNTPTPTTSPARLGMGIGWRPELALAIERRRGLGFVEVVAENLFKSPSASEPSIPPALDSLQQRGVKIVPHGISLSLGGGEEIDQARARRLDALARRVDAPLVSEHIAFVRAGNIEAGHLLPVPRTRGALNVLVDNVRRAQDVLSVPLALENISALFQWPDRQIDEAEFLAEVLDRTGAWLLLDVANVYANAKNLGGDSFAMIERLPLQRLAYVHVGGGEERDGVYHDSHAGAVPQGALRLLETLCGKVDPPGVMLERDDHFPSAAELNAELDAIESAVAAGRSRRIGCTPRP